LINGALPITERFLVKNQFIYGMVPKGLSSCFVMKIFVNELLELEKGFQLEIDGKIEEFVVALALTLGKSLFF
jgi:hypothetical protein